MNITDESRFRILIVDDNEAIHQDLKKILVPSHDTASLDEDEALLFGTATRDTVSFELDSAFQGPEALEKVESALASSDPYALAFIDIRMPPGWDGIETIERVWKKDRDLQVVICTAYSDYNWQDIERRVGLSHNLVVLKKPFDPIEVTQLAHALTAKWRGSRQMREQLKELDLLVEKRTAELRSTVEELERAKEQSGSSVTGRPPDEAAESQAVYASPHVVSGALQGNGRVFLRCPIPRCGQIQICQRQSRACRRRRAPDRDRR